VCLCVSGVIRVGQLMFGIMTVYVVIGCRLCLLCPPHELLKMLLHRKMPIVLKDVLRVANCLNQHIDGHTPRQAKGALFFLVSSNLLWSFIQILSNLATDPKHKVCVGFGAVSSLCPVCLGHFVFVQIMHVFISSYVCDV
jgi:hypothetical protein